MRSTSAANLPKSLRKKTHRLLYFLSQMFGFLVLHSTLLACFLKGFHAINPRNSRRKLSQLVSNHVFRYRDEVVILAIVNLEPQPDKVGQDGRRAGLRSHRRDLLAGRLGPDNGQAVTLG